MLALKQLESNNNTVVEEVNYHLMLSLNELINQQLIARDTPDAKARFVLKNTTKFIERHEYRRMQIEKQLFNTTTPYALTHHPINSTILNDGRILRPLHASDTSQINALFERRSSKSFNNINRQITTNPTTCLGIFLPNNNILAYILQYENGILGMLHVKEEYRNKGYGTLLVQKATNVLENEGRECIAYILDGNIKSERIFSKIGWIKANPLESKGKSGRRRAPRM